jgi:prophage antirepressor-like protein
MSNDLQVWQYNKNKFRTVTKDGEPWFVAKDLSDILECRDPEQALRGLEDSEKGTTIVGTLGGQQSMTVINESGMYALILKSRKKEAKYFRLWVTGTVLPEIRKHGTYAIATATPALTVPATFSEALFLAAKQAEQVKQWLTHQTSWTSEAASYTATFFTVRRR